MRIAEIHDEPKRMEGVIMTATDVVNDVSWSWVRSLKPEATGELKEMKSEGQVLNAEQSPTTDLNLTPSRPLR